MHEPNVQVILDLLRPEDRVLDIGGWACPFNRANHVMDAQPYETRGFYATFGGKASQGGETEHFSAETWIQRDLCDREPYPFEDDELDFVICSHTLEDLRDPLWVCSEMMRIAKRGYLEVPSREMESCRGWFHPKVAGLLHHRWLVDQDGNKLRFLMKPHSMHSHWRFSFPHRHLKALPEERYNLCMFWEGSFEVSETMIHGIDETDRELESFVAGIRPYPAPLLAADRTWRKGRNLLRRVQGKVGRVLAGR